MSNGTVFRPGQYYRHTNGQTMWVLGYLPTRSYGYGLIAERYDGTLIRVGKDEESAANWREFDPWGDWQSSEDSADDPHAETTRLYGSDKARKAICDMVSKENATLRARERAVLEGAYQVILGSNLAPKWAEYMVRHLKERLGKGESDA